MTIERTATLADLVTEAPALAGTFERLGIDFCCGGARSLADAVAEAGLDEEAVLIELRATTTEPGGRSVLDDSWTDLGVAELVAHLETTHHPYLREALPRLDALAEKVAGVHGERHPELHQVRRIVAELMADLLPHMMKEERVLFPMVRELAVAVETPRFHCGSLANPIGVMNVEHERTGELLTDLRIATSGYRVPEDGCGSWRALYVGLAELEADTHLHVHKENNVLFPAVLAAEAAVGG